MKKCIQTKDLIINLIKYNNSDRITTIDYLELLKFIYKKLKEQKLLDKYEIAFEIDTESLKRVAEYNSDILVDEIEYSNEIRIKSPTKLEDYFKKYSIDETVDEIIKNYCELKSIDDIKPEHFISRPTIQSTPTINFKGAITSNEMSDIVEEKSKVKTLQINR
ncbi:MAG: hypothetical protein E7170_04205 [Firmicutes bacterium]|nr:hypothetical protein [Bacillota bacterium]